MHCRRGAALSCAFMLLMASTAVAQQPGTGELSGQVLDSQGAAVAGAQVSLADTAKALSFRAFSL